MVTVTDLIRKQMYSKRGIDETPVRKPHDVLCETARMNNKLDEVIRLARDRLTMGSIRYGSNWGHDDLMDYMQVKFDTFKDTGNYEMLIDLLNFVVIEGELKTHPKHNFSPVDRE